MCLDSRSAGLGSIPALVKFGAACQGGGENTSELQESNPGWAPTSDPRSEILGVKVV